MRLSLTLRSILLFAITIPSDNFPSPLMLADLAVWCLDDLDFTLQCSSEKQMNGLNMQLILLRLQGSTEKHSRTVMQMANYRINARRAMDTFQVRPTIDFTRLILVMFCIRCSFCPFLIDEVKSIMAEALAADSEARALEIQAGLFHCRIIEIQILVRTFVRAADAP